MCSDSHRTKDWWSKYFNSNICSEIGGTRNWGQASILFNRKSANQSIQRTRRWRAPLMVGVMLNKTVWHMELNNLQALLNVAKDYAVAVCSSLPDTIEVGDVVQYQQ